MARHHSITIVVPDRDSRHSSTVFSTTCVFRSETIVGPRPQEVTRTDPGPFRACAPAVGHIDARTGFLLVYHCCFCDFGPQCALPDPLSARVQS
jgi:hypothetical protein